MKLAGWKKKTKVGNPSEKKCRKNGRSISFIKKKFFFVFSFRLIFVWTCTNEVYVRYNVPRGPIITLKITREKYACKYITSFFNFPH